MDAILHLLQPRPPVKKFTGNRLRLLALTAAICLCNGLFGITHKTAVKPSGAGIAGITSISTVTPSPTNAATVQYTVTLDAPVTGVTAGNFSLTANGVTGAAISSISGSGQTYTVTVNTGTGNGSIGLNLANSTGISPGITTALPFAGQTYTIDKTAPGVTELYEYSSNVNSTVAVVGDVVSLDFGTSEAIQTPANVTIGGHTVIPVSTGGNNYIANYTMTSSDTTGRVHFTLQFTDLAGNVSPFFTDLAAGDNVEFSATAPFASNVTFVSNNANNATAIIGNKVTLTFTASEAIQTPAITIAGHSVTAINKGSNTYAASYTMAAADASGNIAFQATLTDASNVTTIITNISANKNVLFNNNPTVSATGSIAAFSTVPGTPSGSRQFSVSGFNLSQGILVEPPSGFELSTDNSTFTRTVTVGTGGVVPSTVVYIRLSALDLSGTYGNDILVGSAGTNEATLPVANSTVAVLLSSLSLSSGTLSPVFKNTTINYSSSVANTVSSITVTARNADGVASITVNGVAESSGYPSASLPLAVGPNTITVLETSADNTLTKTYTITVTRAPSSNDNLKSIGQSVGPLTPAFSSTITSYAISTVNTTASMTVKPVTSDAGATVKVNGAAVAPGAVSQPIALAEGAQTLIHILVTAQNGIASQTYTVTVSRAPSSDATLSNIQLNSGALDPVFASATTAYTADAANSFSAITVTPAVADANATVTVNGTAVSPGAASAPVALTVGANIITIVVTAQDGITTKTYTVTVTRAASSNASLAAFKTSRGTLTPVFATGTTGYTANVVNGVTSTTVTPTVADPTATIAVNGITVASGSASGAIALAVGSNVINTVVTAQDGVTVKTYTLTVTRAVNAADSFVPAAIGIGISVTEPTETPTLDEDVIIVHQALSPNGDGVNDFLVIDGIQAYPDNKLSIMNRNGQLIYQAIGYDNSSKVFDGHSSKNGQMQLPGTYFYQLDYTVKGITKHKTGFLVLKY